MYRYLSNFLQLLTFSMCNRQPTNKMMAITAKLNWQYFIYRLFFNGKSGNSMRMFDLGGRG